MSATTKLIADIGGTNARFALASEKQPFFTHAQTFQCRDFNDTHEAIDAYLSAQNVDDIETICFAVAGPIINGTVRFTNNHWSVDSEFLRTRYTTDSVHLLNDFAAIAYSLPLMREDDLLAIGKGEREGENYDSDGDFKIAVVGPGTGLGVAGLVKLNGVIMPMVTEGGHVGFSPESEIQVKLLERLQLKYDRVSNERLLSGPGLMNIHEALCEIFGKENPGLSAADIAIGGTRGSDEMCKKSMDLFFEILGQVAGDVALSLGSYQGIYIGGGIAQRYPDQLLASNFRKGFEHKGRYQELMKRIPTWLIRRQNPGLVGCSAFVNGSLSQS